VAKAKAKKTTPAKKPAPAKKPSKPAKPVAKKPAPKTATKAAPVKAAPAKPTPAKSVAAKKSEPKVAAKTNSKASQPIKANTKSVVVEPKLVAPKAAAKAETGKAAGKAGKNGKPAPGAPTFKIPVGAIAVKFPASVRNANGLHADPTPAKPVKAKRIEHPEPVIVAPPKPAVSTSEKRSKNPHFGERDLDLFRELLLAKRRELVGDMHSMEREALRENSSDLSNLPVHMADQGTDAYEQEFTLTLVEKERTMLRDVNDALAKIQNGTYGVCEGTGLPISKARLEAVPWSRYSIEHQRAVERKNNPFRR
jgi:DnaK suppressor protein